MIIQMRNLDFDAHVLGYRSRNYSSFQVLFSSQGLVPCLALSTPPLSILHPSGSHSHAEHLRFHLQQPSAHLVVCREDPPEGSCEMLAETYRIGGHLLTEFLDDRLQSAHQIIVIHL